MPKLTWGLILIGLLGAILMVKSNVGKIQNDSDYSKTQEWESANMQHSIEFNTDVAELVKRLRLPVQPIKVWWYESVSGNPDNKVPGPTDVSMQVCMELKAGDSQVLLNNFDLGEPLLRLSDSYTSMPAPFEQLGKQYRAEVYDAVRLVRPPYTRGRLDIIVDTQLIEIALGS